MKCVKTSCVAKEVNFGMILLVNQLFQFFKINITIILFQSEVLLMESGHSECRHIEYNKKRKIPKLAALKTSQMIMAGQSARSSPKLQSMV